MSLTLEDKRLKIAEATKAWRLVEHGFWEYFDSRDRVWTKCRDNDPINDLNACAELEATLTDEEHCAYCNHLGEIVGDARFFVRRFVSSTAAQKAEAYGRTKGLWT